jgi:hypothetical protein
MTSRMSHAAISRRRYLESAFRLLTNPDRQPPVPELVVSTASGMLAHILPQYGLRKELERWLFDLQRVVAAAYVLAVAETWDSLDRERAMRVINEGLAEVSRQLEEREGSPLNYSDWDDRISTTVYGLAGGRTSYASAWS